jgi:signal transduction histidine kinase/CheY-like chemotaxis protein
MPPHTTEHDLELSRSDRDPFRSTRRPLPDSRSRLAENGAEGVVGFPRDRLRRNGRSVEAGAAEAGRPALGDEILAGRFLGHPEAAILELTRSLSSHLEIDMLLDAIVRGAMELIECEGGFAAALIDGKLRSRRYVRDGHALPLERSWNRGEGLPGWVLRHNLPCLVNGPEADRRLDPEVVERFAVRSALAVPVRDPRGGVAGVVVLHNRRRPSGFSRQDAQVLEEVARSAAVALESAKAFEALRRERTPDPIASDHSQRLEAVGRFAAGIAHDFNNFLTVVLGQTDLLLHSSNGEGHRRELGELRDAALRARFLTRRLLSFSRKGPTEAETLDVAGHVTEAVRLLRRLVGTNVELRSELARDLPPVDLAPGHLDQILMNLASNSRDAMLPRGGTLVIRGRRASEDEAGPAGEGVVLEVEDTGEGMDRSTLDQIFEPYFTTKPTDEGTGLGLATVAAIVRDSGGRIEVRSVRGEGSVFSIFLPAAGARGLGKRMESGFDEREGDDPATILLVEDEDSVRRLVRRVLQRKGYRVLEAPSGARAVELAEDRGRPVDLLLTDVMLPDMGGIQLWQLLSGRVAGRKTIFMSGYLEDDLPQVELQRNEVEFLPKPFAIQDLLGLVENVLGSG